MREISVRELAEWRASGKPFVLLDVREDDEVRAASIPGAAHIPMGEIPARAGELDRSATVAVLCHHGSRSERVASFLEAQGFTDVWNVEGGIHAYAVEVDPAIPTYR
ncbi:MAG TPA: rhodanese-like domain-containing protein [Vicinamibacterales bacterium]|jgi:rhodanese-related sulfurtransferase|nr:rhodanese-like domain-containing protein [Vicinamibacterales bacterium]